MNLLSPIAAGSASTTRKSVRELHRVAALAVPAGTTGTIVSLNDIDATFVTLLWRADSGHAHEPSIQFLAQTGVTPAVNSTISPSFVPDNIRWDGNLRAATGWIEVISGRASFFMRNQSVADHTYDIVISGLG